MIEQSVVADLLIGVSYKTVSLARVMRGQCVRWVEKGGGTEREDIEDGVWNWGMTEKTHNV